MKGIIFTVLLALGAAASADTYVRPYMRSDGTSVQGYYRSSPNTYRYDNYSSSGNVNLHTGQRGYGRNEFHPRQLTITATVIRRLTTTTTSALPTKG